MEKLKDTDLMPIGKFKGEKMENVPYWHLLWFYDQPYCRNDVKEYVEENMDVLNAEYNRSNHINKQ